MTFSNKMTQICVLSLNLLSLLAFFVCMFSLNVSNEYILLPLLPLAFFGIVFFIFATGKWRYLSSVSIVGIVVALYFIRMVILPILIVKSNYSYYFGAYATCVDISQVSAHISLAIIMLVFEAICVFVVIFNNSNRYSKNRLISNGYTIKTSTSLFRIVLIGIIVYVLFAMFTYPTLALYFKSIFSLFNEKNIEIAIQGNSPSIIYRSFTMACDILQILLPIVLIKKIYRIPVNKSIKCFLSILVVALSLIIMTEDHVVSFIIAFVLLLILGRLYEKAITKYYSVLFAALALLLITAFLYKTGYSNYSTSNRFFEILAGTVNGYFSGPQNIAAALCLNSNSRPLVMLGGLLNSIPFFPIFFKEMTTTPKLFNYFIKGYGSKVTKIIPMIGQGAFYFSPFFAPVFSCFSVYCARKIHYRVASEDDLIKAYLLTIMMIVCAIGPCVYSVNIVLKSLLNFCTIYLILMTNKITIAGK